MESRQEAIQKELDAEIFPVPILVKKLKDAKFELGKPTDPEEATYSAMHILIDALLQYFQKQIP